MAQMQNLNWDAELDEKETAAASALLPAGEYAFRVMSFVRGFYPGGAKLPQCNKAVLEFDILGDNGETLRTIKSHSFFLLLDKDDRGNDGVQLRILKNFFACVGLRKHGEKFKMDWNKTLGRTGRCKVIVEKFKDKEGNDKETNKIHYFLDPSENAAAEKPAKPSPDADTPF